MQEKVIEVKEEKVENEWGIRTVSAEESSVQENKVKVTSSKNELLAQMKALKKN